VNQSLARPAIRCARCRRALENPTWIGGLPFGPECKNRAGVLAARLERERLELPMTLDLEPMGDGYRYPDAMEGLLSAAARAGVMLKTKMNWEEKTVYISLEVPSPKLWAKLEDQHAQSLARLKNTVQHAIGGAA
jgi:hypothetical protein